MSGDRNRRWILGQIPLDVRDRITEGMEARRVKTRRSQGFSDSRQPGPEGRRPYAREKHAMSVLASDS
jgi:hypothetical protein